MSIKTWRDRIIVTKDLGNRHIQTAMKEEIGELRAALKERDQAVPLSEWQQMEAKLQERDAEIEGLSETVRVYDKRIVALGYLAMETVSHGMTRNCGERFKVEIAAQRKVLEQALEALNGLFTFKVDEHRGARCAAAITAIQEQLK